MKVLVIVQHAAQGRHPEGESVCVMAVCAGMCTFGTFPPGWRSDPGPPPVTLWMIAVEETCLISAPMLSF